MRAELSDLTVPRPAVELSAVHRTDPVLTGALHTALAATREHVFDTLQTPPTALRHHLITDPQKEPPCPASRHRRHLAAAAAAVALVLGTAACTGSSSGGASDDPNAKTTITFWHGWSAPNEVKGIQDNIAAFEKEHPNITVKAVSNITDDKINQALRAGGPKAPDVVSSFTTDNVGEFCNSHAFVDLDAVPQEVRHRPGRDLPAGAARLHPVQGQPVLAAAAQRRLRPVLQQDDVREGGHQAHRPRRCPSSRPTR